MILVHPGAFLYQTSPVAPRWSGVGQAGQRRGGVSIAGGACSENNGSQFQGQGLLHNLQGTEHKKKKGKNVGTLVQTSKKVKDTKAKSINARLSCWEPPGCAQSVTRSRDERGACKAVLPLGVVLGARYVPFLFLSYCWVFD